MRNLALFLALFLAPVLQLRAQVSVEIMMDQDRFLPNEAVSVAVRVVNHSGQTLQLGAEPDWLAFNIEAKDGRLIAKSGEVPVVNEFSLDSSKMGTERFDLQPYFNIARPGRYTVTAIVKIKDWGDRVFTSGPKVFDIITGFRLWETEFGVPLAAGAGSAEPEVRKYVLQQANYSERMTLYLRITDAAESQVFKVFPIGPMVSFSRPEPQLDKYSNLHLLYQTAAHTFNYSIINPAGKVLLRRTYDYTTTRPRLKLDASGEFIITGGARRIASNDLPPSKDPTPHDDIAKTPHP
ncbi:MAG TPA: hypothetical protein VH598_12215 [Verrucomicrobiae bacterium]|nr:hypothetical protein [Verrucomicrobiae bacterium]